MFTGIIEEQGKVESLIRFHDRAVITISAKYMSDVKPSDSISVNGACLTVSEISKGSFKADIMKETFAKTSLTYLKYGEHVNLERAMLADGRFNGHIVQGHVDCRSKIFNIINTGSEKEIEIALPDEYGKFVTEKGSIAVDGISLTVSGLTHRSFKISMIPHTTQNTNLSNKKIGDFVNLEFDVLAKYLDSLARTKPFNALADMKDAKIDGEFLKRAGFLN
jgi:riboflavin synthase